MSCFMKARIMAIRQPLSKLPQLRITVNSRCGRRCFFCRPSGEALATPAGTALDRATIAKVVTSYVKCGGKFVKLTGGEPAIWPDLVSCVTDLKHEIGVEELHVISRHPSIGITAPSLATAGVDLINISVDTLNTQLHQEITGVPDLTKILDAVKQCVDTGVPVKINTVVMKGINDEQLDKLVEFCENVGVQSLKLLDTIADLGTGSESNTNHLYQLRGQSLEYLHCNLDDLIAPYRERAIHTRIFGQGDLGHPMLGLTLASGLEIVVKDRNAGAWYGSICNGCHYYPCHDALMAIRLTSDSRLQFCLLNEDVAIDLAPHLTADQKTITKVMESALAVYDKAHFVCEVMEAI